MNTSTINTRVNKEIKDKATKILEKLGLTMSQAITLYLNQIIYTNSIPFDLYVPTEETKKAMEEALYIESHPDEFESFSKVAELVEEYKSENN